MSEKIEVELEVTGTDAAASDIVSVDDKIKELGTGFGLVQKLADKMTGGMASGMINAYKSTKTFIKGLNLTKAAMISTGIGALVVAVGALSVSLAKAGGETSAWNRELVKSAASWRAFGNNLKAVSIALLKFIMLDGAGAFAHLAENLGWASTEVDKAVTLWEQYHANLKEVIRLQREMVLDTASSSLEQYKLNQQINDGSLSMEGRIRAMKNLTVEEYALIDAKEEALRLEIATIDLAAITGNLEEGDLDRKIAATAALTRLMVERYKVSEKYKKGVETLRTQEADTAREQADRAIAAANEVRAAENAKKEAIFAANKARIEGVENTLDAAENLLLSAQEKELKALDEQQNKVLKAAMENIAHLRSAARQAAQWEIDAAIEYADLLEAALQAKRDEINKKYADAAAAVVAETAAEVAEAQAKIDDDALAAKELSDQKILDAELELAAKLKASRADVQASALASIDAVVEGQRIAAMSGAKSEEESEAISKKFAAKKRKIAIANILLAQGQALASAIAGAQAAALASGPLAPVMSPLLTAQMVGIVLGGFAGIKGIMNQAGAAMPEFGDVDTGGGGSGGGSTQLSLMPTLDSFGEGTLQLPAVQAFIIQNDIADAATLQAELQAQASL